MRIEWLKSWMVSDVLKRFTPPRDVDPSIAAKDAVELINSNLPSVETREQFEAYLPKILSHMQRNARGRTLPVPKDILEAVHAAVRDSAPRESKPSETPGVSVHTHINARRIKNGEAVAEYWLSERGMAELLEHTDLTEEDFKKYLA